MQEAAGPGQGLGQGGRRQAAAAEEFETADTHRLGKQTESLVVECPVQQVIQCGIAIHGNSAGVICKIEADLTQEIFCVDTAPIKPGQHAANKFNCNSGLTWVFGRWNAALHQIRPGVRKLNNACDYGRICMIVVKVGNGVVAKAT